MIAGRREFWVNQAFFQLAWPACVIGPAFGLLWPAALLIAGFLAWQLQPVRRHPDDVRTLAAFVAMGLVFDTAWVQLGLVAYTAAVPFEGLQPAWLTGLWIALALTVHHSLAVFRERWWLWVLLASVASPLSYTMAARVGAIEWTAAPWLVVLAIGPFWGLATGLLFLRARGADRARTGSAAGAAAATPTTATTETVNG
ncbi:DUF2878 domain-containing protein [Wenzhouxiangella sp. XN79A]|uniref:DUF2878 family protein n=1 Tax=Wenzhouxiangella sp. XN79A TaxID=2724193 RepID=UPI00144AB163|nr:DUF2878 domain-containing protein [Wenzhouxiangella sp. XN79A]